jgi:hypothetical protein
LSITWEEKKEAPKPEPVNVETTKQTYYPRQNTRTNRYRPRYRDLFTYKSPTPEIIITTYQVSQQKEKVYLASMIQFKRFVDNIANLKLNQKPMITFDEYRKQKKWLTDINLPLRRKRHSYDWMEMNNKQTDHWKTIAREKIDLMIIENTPRTIYLIEYDYHSLQSEELFEEISNISYDEEYSGCQKESARKIILDDYYNNNDYKLENVKKEYFKDYWFRSLIPIEVESIFQASTDIVLSLITK